MTTTVAEMTPEGLRTLILETVQVALAETMGGPDCSNLPGPPARLWMGSLLLRTAV